MALIETLKQKFADFVSKLSPEEHRAMLDDLEEESATVKALGPAALIPDNDDDYEIRHQAVYDHVSGTESFQPVRVKKSDVSTTAGVGPASLR